LTAGGADALVHVHEMVRNIVLPGVPMVTAVGVLTTSIAHSVGTIVFVDFKSNMLVASKNLLGHMWHWIFSVGLTPSLVVELLVGKVGKVYITHSWLTEVDHGDLEPVAEKVHAGEVGKGTAERVTGHLYHVVRVQSVEPIDFSEDLISNIIGSRVEALMYHAVA